MEIAFTLDDLSQGLPLMLLVLGALGSLLIGGGRRATWNGILCLALQALAFFWTLAVLQGYKGVDELDPTRKGKVTHILGEMYLVDTPHLMGHLLLIGSAFFAGWLAFAPGRPDRRQATNPAFWTLIQLATAGGMIMVSGANLMVCFLGLELLAFSLYLLTAIRPDRRANLEAGLKLYLLGAFAAALFVFGLALTYAGRGTVELPAFRIQWLVRPEVTGMAGLGTTLVFAALLFKAALFPFHMWSPDAHQGAPTPAAAFLASATSVAPFVLLLCMASLVPPEVRYAIPVIATLALAAGNLGALRQLDLKRLLAYSALAHAGCLLIGLNSVMASDGWPDAWQSIRGVYFYLVAFTCANLGAFGIVFWIETNSGQPGRLAALEGLGRRHPWIAALFALCLLSLTGTPLTAGFWARFYLFSQAIRQGFYVLSALGLLLTAVGLCYTLKLLMAMYMREPTMYLREPMDFRLKPRSFPWLLLPTWAAAFGVLLFGLAPNLLFDFLYWLQL